MYEPSRRMSAFFIAGFRYYDGAQVLDKLVPGKKLKMVPQPDNPYDPNAIELYYKKVKLGFVPREKNETLAMMLHYGHGKVFEARVLQVNPLADPRAQVCVGVSVVDAR